MAHYEETAYGFQYGAAKVERICSDLPAPGAVTLGIVSPKCQLQVYVTKTGKVRVWKDGREMFAAPEEAQP